MNADLACSHVKKSNPQPECLENGYYCPMMQFVNLVSGKWSIPVLYRLIMIDQPVRFSELLRHLAPVTQKELTRHLRAFEKKGLVRRTIYPEVPPRVEYQITELGKTLQQPLTGLAEWMQHNAAALPNNAIET